MRLNLRSWCKNTQLGARASPALTEDRMNSRFVKGASALASVLVVSAAAKTASAAILLQDNFDGYADQAAFQAAWPAIAGNVTGTLSTAQAFSSPNSFYISSSGSTATSPRNGRSFAESGNPSASNPITFSFDIYDTNAAAQPFRQYENLQDSASPGGAGQLVSLGLNNNHSRATDGGNFYMARILGYTPVAYQPSTDPVLFPNPAPASGAYFKLNDDPTLLRTTGWHNLKVTITDVDYRFYVDNQLAEVVGNTLTLRSYDN